MTIPKKKKRIRLLIILSRQEDYYGVKMLSQMQPILDKMDASQSLTSNETAVITALDGYYDAYDPGGIAEFDPCCCSALDSETQGTVADLLEDRMNTYLGL